MNVVLEAARQITTMTHFYSQNDDLCMGALRDAANRLGESMLEEDLRPLVPVLRDVLNRVQGAQ